MRCLVLMVISIGEACEGACVWPIKEVLGARVSSAKQLGEQVTVKHGIRMKQDESGLKS